MADFGMRAKPRKCAWCGAAHEGWAEVHLLVSETGLTFCSTMCHERMEADCDSDILIVAESGTQADPPFGNVELAERS